MCLVSWHDLCFLTLKQHFKVCGRMSCQNWMMEVSMVSYMIHILCLKKRGILISFHLLKKHLDY